MSCILCNRIAFFYIQVKEWDDYQAVSWPLFTLISAIISGCRRYGIAQSGKTTLVKESFPDYAYVSLEDLDMQRAAKEDPRTFFATYSARAGLIIDEIQEVPELLSYMQWDCRQCLSSRFFYYYRLSAFFAS